MALLGPRQVGKTTLAHQVGGKAAVYLDLENPADIAKLADPVAYLSAQKGLVILDEVQRLPGLFPILRGVIDKRVRSGDRAGHFLLLGSASLDVLQQSSETLAGRLDYLELGPLDLLEVGAEQAEKLWLRGGFPRSFLSNSEAQSVAWRAAFIRSYLERDIPLLGPRIAAETLRRFWTMLAHSQGGLLNAARLASALAVDGKTIARYLDLLVDLLLVRRLPPYHTNSGKRLVKSPKIYLKDSGILHTLLGIDRQDALLSHPICGASYEGFAIETLLRAAPERTEASFYRTATGVEADVVLEFKDGEIWLIEIKRTSAPKLEKGLKQAISDLNPARSFIVYNGSERYPLGPNIEAIPLAILAKELGKE